MLPDAGVRPCTEGEVSGSGGPARRLEPTVGVEAIRVGEDPFIQVRHDRAQENVCRPTHRDSGDRRRPDGLAVEVAGGRQ